MNLRLPIVLSVVAVAAGAAAVRSFHPAAATSPAAFASEESAVPARRPLAEQTHPAAAPLLVVYVAGAVARGGVYRLAAASRAVDAVRAAGGATATADLVAVNLAARLSDGDEVVVPEKGAENDVVPSSVETAPAHHKRRKHHKKKRKHHKAHAIAAAVADDSADDETATAETAPATPVDINAADASELETLPGIGSGLADRIVTFRELNGPFNAADDLLDVAGMTQKRLDVIEPFLVL